jgi:hypothetical protein
MGCGASSDVAAHAGLPAPAQQQQQQQQQQAGALPHKHDVPPAAAAGTAGTAHSAPGTPQGTC